MAPRRSLPNAAAESSSAPSSSTTRRAALSGPPASSATTTATASSSNASASRTSHAPISSSSSAPAVPAFLKKDRTRRQKLVINDRGIDPELLKNIPEYSGPLPFKIWSTKDSVKRRNNYERRARATIAMAMRIEEIRQQMAGRAPTGPIELTEQQINDILQVKEIKLEQNVLPRGTQVRALMKLQKVANGGKALKLAERKALLAHGGGAAALGLNLTMSSPTGFDSPPPKEESVPYSGKSIKLKIPVSVAPSSSSSSTSTKVVQKRKRIMSPTDDREEGDESELSNAVSDDNEAIEMTNNEQLSDLDALDSTAAAVELGKVKRIVRREEAREREEQMRATAASSSRRRSTRQGRASTAVAIADPLVESTQDMVETLRTTALFEEHLNPPPKSKVQPGPAGVKDFLMEGLYCNSSHTEDAPVEAVSMNGASNATLISDDEPKKKRHRRSYFEVVTVLSDGTMVPGKLPLDIPVDLERDDEEQAGEAIDPEQAFSKALEEENEKDNVRRRLRFRTSIGGGGGCSAFSSRSSSPSPPINTSVPIPSTSLGTPIGTKPASKSAVVTRSARSKAAAASHKTPFTFPLPIHYGLQLLERERDFKLTYDIIWEWEQGGLGEPRPESSSGGKKVPSVFKAIVKNVFPERPRDKAPIAAVCDCKLPEGEDEEGCGDSCINRMLQYLCSPKTCPCGDSCSNKSLYRRARPGMKVFWTGDRGFGLKALEDINEGDFVTDYRGEVIPIPTYYTRIISTYSTRSDFYALEYGEGEVIDAGLKGNVARFINHGCDPNLEVRKYTTLGEGIEEYEIGLWAKCDIQAGEELFYNYNFDSFSNRPSNSGAASTSEDTPANLADGGGGCQRCCCGAEACTGWIGGKKGKKK